MVKIVELDKPNMGKVKMNCDDIIDNKLTKYPMVNDVWSKTSFNIIVGKMGQGKTSLITNLVKKVFKGVFHHMYVFIPHNSRVSIDNDIYGKYIPDECLYDTLSEESLAEVYEKLKEHSDNCEYSLLIIDDFQAQLKDPEIVKMLQKIITKQRHLRATTFLLQQNFQALVKPLRELVGNVITYNVGKSQLTKMFDEIVQMEKDKYQELIDLAFKDPHDWILININGNRNIYRMFDKIELE
jgi:DNA replication protein DnaC